MKYFYKNRFIEGEILTPKEAELKYKVPFITYSCGDKCIIYLSPTDFNHHKNPWGFYGWDIFDPVRHIPEDVYNSPLYKAMMEE